VSMMLVQLVNYTKVLRTRRNTLSQEVFSLSLLLCLKFEAILAFEGYQFNARGLPRWPKVESARLQPAANYGPTDFRASSPKRFRQIELKICAVDIDFGARKALVKKLSCVRLADPDAEHSALPGFGSHLCALLKVFYAASDFTVPARCSAVRTELARTNGGKNNRFPRWFGD